MPDLSSPAHASHHISRYSLATKQSRINSYIRYRARISLQSHYKMTIGEIPLKMSVPPHAEDCGVLTPAQQKCAPPLSAGPTTPAAARAAGVHRNTVTNWRRNPAIQAALTQDSQAKANLWLGETDPVVLLKAALALLELQRHAPLAAPETAIRETPDSVDAPCRPAAMP